MSDAELEEQIFPLNIHRKITDFVNNEQLILAQRFGLSGRQLSRIGFFELLNERTAADVISK